MTSCAMGASSFGNCRRILLVNEAADNLGGLLQEEGYEVYRASDRHSVVRLIKAHSPVLILIDASASTVDCRGVLQAIKREFKTAVIPVVVLGGLEDVDKSQAFQYGATDYISKSSGLASLLARLNYQMGRQLAKLQQRRLSADLERRLEERDRLLGLARDQLLEVALSDRLTQLPNRLSFVKRLSKVMARYGGPLAAIAESEKERNFAVLFLDCDRFKRINDSLGHRIGDLLLKDVASRLLAVQETRDCVDTVARFGGDEFALLVTDVADRSVVAAIAEEVLNRLSSPFALADRRVYMSASIGMVWGEASYTTPEHMLRDADMAMYQAKASHRSQIHWFESNMHHQAVGLLQLETDLHLALAREEFELYYQPIVDLTRLKIVGFEALVRWHHPTRGLLLPGEFVDFAEESGFIISLGEQVLEMACADIARWVSDGAIDSEITVSVNIAAQQLLQPDILERLREVVTRWKVDPRRLHLELTERSILDSQVFVNDVLEGFQRRGIKLSIDDFGVGYSALSYLHRLPVSCLKVDRSFVHPITEDPSSLGIVPLIINIAKTMNMQVIAEGIENEVQLRQLQQLDCQSGQGFLFERAVPAERAIAMLDEPIVLPSAQSARYSAKDLKASA